MKLDQTQTTMLVAVLFLTLLVYLRCLGNGFVNDERWEVVENRYLEQWSFFWNSLTRDAWWFSNPHRLPQSAYYRPIQNLWIALNFHLFGLNPIGWRAVKVLLHLCAVILVFRVSQLLSRSVSAALLSALLFGLLPVNTESVVWSVGPPQAAVLELTAFWLFIGRRKGDWRGFVWPVTAFAGATFSHESAVVFPVLIAAYVFLFETGNKDLASSSDRTHDQRRSGVELKCGRARFKMMSLDPRTFPAMPKQGEGSSKVISSRIRTAAARSAPFFAASLLYMVARVLVLGIRGIPGLEGTLHTLVLANGRQTFETADAGHSQTQILMTLPTVLVHYLEIFIFP